VTSYQTKASLRSLAERLECSHAALSKQVHAGRLTNGVHVDAHGRVVVTDAEAAAAQWKNIHVVRVDEMVRQTADRARRSAPAASEAASEDFFADLSKQDLLERWAAYDLLARALVDAALKGASDRKVRAFSERIASQMREAPLQYADTETLADAETLLGELVNEALNRQPE
jgi:hypothetical protein